MRNQLIIKPNSGDSPQLISAMRKNIVDSWVYGYPIVLLDGWEYEIIECSEPVMVVKDNKIDKNDFVYAMKNAGLSIVDNNHDGCEGCKYIDSSENDEPCKTCKQNYVDNYVCKK